MSSTAATAVQEIAFAVPFLPGKADAGREVMHSCRQGDREAAHRASRELLGITRESVWIQSTPVGEMAVVHIEARDAERALGGMGTSDDPFDRWFREYCADVHGIDLAEPLPPLEQVLAFRL